MEIPVKIKDKVYGETFNVGELIDALNDEIFKDENAPINVQTKDYSGEVVAIYECKNCDRLHILANNFGDNEDEDDDTDFLFTKSEVSDMLSNVAQKVHGFQTIIPKKDVLTILNKIDKKMGVMIGTMLDDGSYTLTGVYKCSDKCPAIHLDSSYDQHNFKLN